jgi:acetyltransferase-like isoleucine patch superfamily enzyme
MTAHLIRVPRLNANDEVVRLVAWHVAHGESVGAGEVIASVETTKAMVDLEADGEGIFIPVARVGQFVAIGDVIAGLVSSRDPAAAVSLLREFQSTLSSGGVERVVSAKARKLMEAHGISPADVPGTGGIRESDVRALVGAPSLDVLSDAEQREVLAGLRADEKAIVLFGADLQGSVVVDALNAVGALKIAVFVDDQPRVRYVAGVPVVASAHLELLRTAGFRRAHVCIGNGRAKMFCAERLIKAGFAIEIVVHPTAVVAASAVLGKGVYIGPLAIVGPHAVLGDYVQVNNAATVAHHAIVGAGTRLSDGVHIGGRVTIGDCAFLGIGVTVNANVSIGEDVTVVSGTSVFGDVPPRSVVRADGKSYPARAR